MLHALAGGHAACFVRHMAVTMGVVAVLLCSALRLHHADAEEDVRDLWGKMLDRPQGLPLRRQIQEQEQE